MTDKRFSTDNNMQANSNALVLIVDDDEAIRTMLYKVIRSNGMDAEIAESGEQALKMISRNHYDLILLDVNMDGIDGFDVLHRIRQEKNQTPVIIVSGRKEDYDTLYGLDIGADDYITKPFNPVTLGAKVKAMIRRNRQTTALNTQVLLAGPFRFDTTSLRFFKDGQEIVLSPKESSIMKLFMDNINHIFPKEMIYDLIWGTAIVDDNAVMVYMNRLRQKIEDDPAKPKYIQTVRGLGYRFMV